VPVTVHEGESLVGDLEQLKRYQAVVLTQTPLDITKETECIRNCEVDFVLVAEVGNRQLLLQRRL
jgi:hypothetical protein